MAGGHSDDVFVPVARRAVAVIMLSLSLSLFFSLFLSMPPVRHVSLPRVSVSLGLCPLSRCGKCTRLGVRRPDLLCDLGQVTSPF